MGGRTGDIDPAVVFHLIRNAHMSVDELDTLFNKRSGMTGLTGHGDMREVHKLIAEGDEDAKLALDIYIHRIVGYIGNYTAQMGGLTPSPSRPALARMMKSCAAGSSSSWSPSV